MRTLLRLSLLAITLSAPVLIGAVAFVAGASNGTGDVVGHQDHSFRRDRCSWYCHDRGCHHTARLPAGLTSDEGAFGETIKALFLSGRKTGLGYQGMNILVFCVVWPIVTYFFYTVAVARAIWNLL